MVQPTRQTTQVVLDLLIYPFSGSLAVIASLLLFASWSTRSWTAQAQEAFLGPAAWVPGPL